MVYIVYPYSPTISVKKKKEKKIKWLRVSVNEREREKGRERKREREKENRRQLKEWKNEDREKLYIASIDFVLDIKKGEGREGGRGEVGKLGRFSSCVFFLRKRNQKWRGGKKKEEEKKEIHLSMLSYD